ncbi:MAG: 23S rRNA (uracil(1939)-C(5))-methyltransferase RlmD, partial [Erysipelotrichaceae bacterium]|nr:23S rRNA (uracil(1939)-C(5))-methyltransferase RlmD [Erysipelotrichaceae bacterium]
MAQLKKCRVSAYCGGCQYQGIEYQQQLLNKQKKVEDLFKGQKVNPIIGMDDPYHYRNKVQFAFGRDKKGRIYYGNYVPSTHHIVEIEDCQIASPIANSIVRDIRNLVQSFRLTVFDEDRLEGFLRHVLIRTGHKSSQVMVVLVTGTYVFPRKKDFIKELLKLHPEITTVVMNINSRHTSMVLGERNEVLYGKGYIEDILCGNIFRISPASFYQINPVQTEKLYNRAIEMAQLKKSDVLLDAYCGIGTIGITASRQVREVIGVEINKSAVRDAEINAKINDVENIRFFCQDAGKFMTSTNRKIDAVIMDPARAGADEKFLSSLVRLHPEKIVYVSCNPVTQKRDIRYLVSKGYQVEEMQPVDMFP